MKKFLTLILTAILCLGIFASCELVEDTGDGAGDDVIRALGKIKYFIKSKTLRKEKTEMAIEVFCKNNDTFFMEKIRMIDGVEDSTLIQYNGEYHG